MTTRDRFQSQFTRYGVALASLVLDIIGAGFGSIIAAITSNSTSA